MSRRVFVQPAELTERTIFPGVTLRAAAGDQLMLSRVTFAANAVVERHAHPHEQVGMVVAGSALFIVGSEERWLSPGEMYFIPGGVEHKVMAGEGGCVALDVFHPVREDYL
jgi:quercetin dioxygenase-like cupin family protein